MRNISIGVFISMFCCVIPLLAQEDMTMEQYEQALDKLNANNKIMLENYGYSLNRNYVRVIDKSQIFMAVTEEEAANVEANRNRREEENQPE